MRTLVWPIIVALLALLGGLAGFVGTSGYLGVVVAMEGFVASCHALRIGEARQLITTAQRGDLAKLAVPTASGDRQLISFLMSDCSRSPYDHFVDGAKH